MPLHKPPPGWTEPRHGVGEPNSVTATDSWRQARPWLPTPGKASRDLPRTLTCLLPSCRTNALCFRIPEGRPAAHDEGRKKTPRRAGAFRSAAKPFVLDYFAPAAAAFFAL